MRSILPDKLTLKIEQYEEYEQAFLEGYRDDIDQNDLQFYKAWQLWRNSMYCADKVDPDFTYAEQALTEATRLINSFEEREKQ